MRFSCSKSDLMASTNIALRAIPSKTTMPILECILFSADEDNTITLFTNDTELAIKTSLNGNVTEEGTIAISAKLFSEIIRKLPDSEVYVTTDENYVMEIVCEKSKFQISGKLGDEFPAFPQIEKEKNVSISQFTLKEMIRQTVFSISDNDSNPLMLGEYFELIENTLRIISLDGHRISIRRVQLSDSENDMEETIKAIVPGKTLNELSKILSGELDDKMNLNFTRKHVLFEFGNTTVLSRLLDGEYYKVDQMMVYSNYIEVKVNKKDIVSCIDRAMLLVKEMEKKPLIIKLEGNTMNFKMRTSVGKLDEDIAADIKGNDIKIGFNPKFILDALRAIDDEEVTMHFISQRTPCFIRDAEGSYIYMILPINFVE